MNEYLLEADGIWKKYAKNLSSSMKYAFRDMASEFFGLPSVKDLRPQEFWALKDVSFKLKRGESIALMGRNGAGKTTLLKILSGVVRPDFGHVKTSGTIEQILALSAGLKPDLTGRENIHIRAKLKGLNGNQLRDFEEYVISFSELGESIESEILTYSSGMKARLGFAISTAIKPDILILDEVLAVGDLDFRLKCYKRIDEIRKVSGLIFVSHSLGHTARICNRGILLEKGVLKRDGSIQDVLADYQGLSKSNKSTFGGLNFSRINCFLRDNLNWLASSIIMKGEKLELIFDLTNEAFDGCFVKILLLDSSYTPLAEFNTQSIDHYINAKRFDLICGEIWATPGRYFLQVCFLDKNLEQIAVSPFKPLEIKGNFVSPVFWQPRVERVEFF